MLTFFTMLAAVYFGMLLEGFTMALVSMRLARKHAATMQQEMTAFKEHLTNLAGGAEAAPTLN